MFSAAVKKLNFNQAKQAIRPDQIFLVRGKDTSGRRAWYYVLVDKNKREVFKGKEGISILRLPVPIALMASPEAGSSTRVISARVFNRASIVMFSLFFIFFFCVFFFSLLSFGFSFLTLFSFYLGVFLGLFSYILFSSFNF